MTNPANAKTKFFQSRAFKLIYPVIATLLFGIYPVLYFYKKNVSLVLLSSFLRILGIYLVLIILVYGISLWLNHGKAIKAANAASVFMLFMNTYGILFRFVEEKDLFMAKHYTLLPLYLFIAIWLAWQVTHLKTQPSRMLWRGIVLIFGALTLFNTFSILPKEIEKSRVLQTEYTDVEAAATTDGDKYPDIYYLVFDEFSGFKAMRGYWHTAEVEPFKEFLLEKGFFVAEDVLSSGTSTLHQMSIRLNYTEYPDIPGQTDNYYQLIADNAAFKFAKSKGYTSVVFDEISWQYPTMPTINADVLYEIDPSDNSDFGMIFDDFGVLITDNTMFYALSQLYQLEDFGYRPHRNMILLTVDRLGNMGDIPKPRIVYSHLMIPHRPYLYTKTGEMVDSEYYRDWDYYEGYWVYSLGVIAQMVNNILEDADPANPPVIILQSDHGARLHSADYPFQDFTPILFAMYLPGYDISTIPQNVNPVNTFPIVFNHYLGADIPLQEPLEHPLEGD